MGILGGIFRTLKPVDVFSDYGGSITHSPHMPQIAWPDLFLAPELDRFGANAYDPANFFAVKQAL